MPPPSSVALAALVVLLAQAAPAPRPAADAPPAARIATVAVDAAGRPVRDLTPSDFRLMEDGAPRPLDVAVLKQGTGIASPRVFGILLDEFHVSAGAETDEVRAAPGRFVSEDLRPDDLVAVLKPLDPLTPIRFTTDRDAARRAVDAFAGRQGDYTPRTPFEAQLMGRAPAVVKMERARIVTAALAELAEQIAGVPGGRGAILVVSNGFVPDPRRNRERPADVPMVVRAAGHFGVPIYTFAPSAGAAEPGRTAGRDAGGAPAPETATLETLAAQTGGVAVVGAAAFDAGLRAAARDLDAMYVLTWRPVHRGDGTFHAVSIETTRRGVTLRTPPGYWAPVGDPDRAVGVSEPPLTLLYRRSRPVHRSPFVDMWVGFSRGAGGRAEVTLTWEPSRGRYNVRSGTRPVMATLKAATPDGDAIFEGAVGPVAPGTRGGAPPSAVFEAPPGRLELDLTLVDAAGVRVDTDSRDVEVPTTRGTTAVLLPAAVVRASNALEFRAAVADPGAAPSPARVFSRIERLLIRVPAYGAGGAPLPVKATLLNRLGQPMRDLPPMSERTPAGAAQFDLPLAPFAPGEYTILLSAPGPSGDLQQRVAFRVTG